VTRTGWRIVPTANAETAFDGEGARLWGGRWNSMGVPMVYASEHQSLAVLEVRVHIDKTSMSKPYSLMAFEFDDALMAKLPAGALPKDWRREPVPPSVQKVGDDWVKLGKSAILAVPSVILPDEFNLLINPKHPEFAKVSIKPATSLSLDLRMFH
jgi:RES domain-containing protein